ncbi:hypothetical protein VMCG_09330 [Cytospora schulzeri]|uniref:Transcription factor domain-containing protein n=1 Tax=Cytospora schulzeri TaxID=448051 RepID=A0A423VJU0_9PEZI|nr:hypothetical protein VMCG_09330 [Valsa malicola]
MTESPAAFSGVTKKKFAAPPVKSACLACGAGDEVVLPGHAVTEANRCQSRTRECVYTPSRRGGPRVRKRAWAGQNDELKQMPDDVLAMLSQGPADVPRQPVSVPNYIDPGAGLKHLEDWFQDSDFMFDSLFMNSNGPVASTGFISPDVYGTGTPTNAVPMFHVFEEGFEPTSPITLAISAILALIPCPEDVDYQSHDSQVFRRKYAQYFAQSAFETMEKDEEIPDSSVEPSKPLSEEHDHNFRRPFHPCLPAELESIVALDILSVYEYSQRGNLKKMQSRAGQALMNAMELGLHTSNVEDEFTEGRRRVWWMTKPSFTVFAPNFTAKFPTVAADPDAFNVYIKSQRAILAATQFVIELNKAVAKEDADMNPLYERMKDLEASMGPLLSHSETWILPSTTTSPVDPTEDVVARSLRCMAIIKLNSARIKLHRYCAFFDIPVFSRKHCDLKSLNAAERGEEPKRWPTCSCSSFANPFSINTAGAGSSSASSSNGNHSDHQQSPSSNGHGSTPSTATGPTMTTTAATTTVPSQQLPNINTVANFPFSSHQSAKICLKSALNIAHGFDEMPYPNPVGIAIVPQQQQQPPPAGTPPPPPPPPCLLSPTSGIVCPRTMPSFACCAMQCAYALLMVHQKTVSVYQTTSPPGGNGGVGGGGLVDAGPGVVVNGLLVRLQQGLTSIYATLSNYATAFEALGGMRDQIRSAIEDSASFTIPM